MATIDKKAIRARFAAFWPVLANVKLKTKYIAAFGPQPRGSMGFEQLRTTAHLLGIEPFSREVIPIRADVAAWPEVKGLMLARRLFACEFEGTIIEVETYDHVRGTRSIEHIFRYLVAGPR